ncbi:MAG: hypothetical protein JRN15_06660 [Nitrososphaerota archaeon]|nr:hypothetical protein [Nitrososphaerota archaeon]
MKLAIVSLFAILVLFGMNSISFYPAVAQNASAYVITPDGMRLSICVHEIPNASHIQADGHGGALVTAPDGQTTDYPYNPLCASYSSQSNDPINEAAYQYSNSSGGAADPITYYSSEWNVPGNATGGNDGTVVFWDALQTNLSPSDPEIMQPVLVWYGLNTPEWSIASYYIDNGGQVFNTPTISVSPSDTIQGIIQYQSSSQNFYITASDLTTGEGTVTNVNINDVGTQYIALVALETINLSSCSGMPSTSPVTFSSFQLTYQNSTSTTTNVRTSPSPTCGSNISGQIGSSVSISYTPS